MNVYDLIMKHEGQRNLMYKDTLGLNTVGIGHCMDRKPISDAAVMQIFNDDMAEIIKAVRHEYPWWHQLNEVRQAVVLDMVFNMGFAGFNKFKNTINHIAGGTYSAAAMEMLDSLWARQVGDRADELATMMQIGEWPSV